MKNILTYLVAVMTILPSSAFSQIDWTALGAGANGTRYAVKYMVKTHIKANGKVMQDSVPQTSKSEIDFRVVDALGNEKIGEVTYNKVEIPGFSGTDNRFFKEFLEMPTYIKFNNSYFNTKIFEKAVEEGTIFEQFYAVMTAPLESIFNIGLPTDGFEADAKWQLLRRDTIHFKGETTIVTSNYAYQVTGFKDTMGHQCAIVNYHTSSNELPITPEILAIAQQLEILNNYSITTKGRILIDKTSGLPIAHKIWRQQKMDSQMKKEKIDLNSVEEIELVMKENNLAGHRAETAEKLSDYYYRNSTRLPAGTVNDKLANNAKIKLIAPIAWDEIHENEAGTRFWLNGGPKSTLVDKEGNTILKPDNYSIPLWDKNDFFENGYGMVKINSRYEIITREGNHIPIDKKYETVKPFNGGRAVAKLEDKYGGLRGLIDSTGKDLIEPMFSSIEEFNGGFAKVTRDSKQGIIDLNGKIIEPLNANIYVLSNRPYGVTILDKQTKKKTLLSPYTNGKKVEALDNYPNFKGGVAVVSKDEKFGIVDSTCTTIVPLEFDYIEDYKNGGLIVSKNKLQGVFDKYGKLVISIEFEKIINTPEPNLLFVGKNGKMGIMSIDGNVVIPTEYMDIQHVANGVWKVSNDGKYGLLNTKGEILLPIEYDVVNCVNKTQGWVSATKSRKTYIISKDYKDIKPLTERLSYLPCDLKSNVVMQVDSLGKYGLYDFDGNILLPNEYDHIGSLSEHTLMVQKGESTGIVDNKGQFVQPLQIMKITNAKFADKFIVYEQRSRQGILDSHGSIIVEPFFDEIKTTDGSAIQVKLDGRYGILKIKD